MVWKTPLHVLGVQTTLAPKVLWAKVLGFLLSIFGLHVGEIVSPAIVLSPPLYAACDAQRLRWQPPLRQKFVVFSRRTHKNALLTLAAHAQGKHGFDGGVRGKTVFNVAKQLDGQVVDDLLKEVQLRNVHTAHAP